MTTDHRSDLSPALEQLKKSREYLGYSCRRFTHEEATSTDTPTEPAVLEKLTTLGQSWQDYVNAWKAVEELYASQHHEKQSHL